MRISKYNAERHIRLPIYGGAADIEAGAPVMRGATPATNNGALILVGGNNAAPDGVGILNEKLDYSVDGETLIDGTSFVTKDVELFGARIVTAEFDLTSSVTCTQAVSTTTITLTSLEDNIDAAFLYVAAGTGIGQLQYLTASAAGSATLKAAFATSLDTTSKIIKILPRFHQKISLVTDGTKIASQAAVGQCDAFIYDIWMERNDTQVQLNPVKHPGLANLNSGRGVKFGAHFAFRNTAAYTID